MAAMDKAIKKGFIRYVKNHYPSMKPLTIELMVTRSQRLQTTSLEG